MTESVKEKVLEDAIVGAPPESPTHSQRLGGVSGGRGFDPHPLHCGRRGSARLSFLILFLVASAAATVGAKVFLDDRSVRAGYVQQIRDDIARFREAESRFLADSGRFGAMDELPIPFVPSQGVFLEMIRVTDDQWSGRATHSRVEIDCRFDRETVECA